MDAVLRAPAPTARMGATARPASGHAAASAAASLGARAGIAPSFAPLKAVLASARQSRTAGRLSRANMTTCATAIDFPALVNIENAQETLGTQQTRVLCIVPGGTVEALLFFPAIDAIKSSYPNAAIDVLVGPEARPAFDLNRNVRKCIPYALDGNPDSSDFGETMGIIKERYYQYIISGKPLGAKQAVGVGIMTMQGKKYGLLAEAGYFTDLLAEKSLTKCVDAPKNFLQLGTSMYDSLLSTVPEVSDVTAAAAKLCIDIPEGAKAWAKSTLETVGLSEGSYMVVDGVSAGLNASKGGAENFSGAEWAELCGAAGMLVTCASKECADAAGAKASAPGSDPAKLAALISMSKGVVCTNTAALQIARALGKPVVGIMSQATADAFAPGAGVKAVATPAAAKALV